MFVDDAIQHYGAWRVRGFRQRRINRVDSSNERGCLHPASHPHETIALYRLGWRRNGRISRGKDSSEYSPSVPPGTPPSTPPGAPSPVYSSGASFRICTCFGIALGATSLPLSNREAFGLATTRSSLLGGGGGGGATNIVFSKSGRLNACV